MKQAKLYLLMPFLVIGLAGCGKETSPSTSDSKSSESKKSETSKSSSKESELTESKSKPEASHPNAAVKVPAQNPTKEFVIDVRSKKEWDTGHLDNAVLIPHNEIVDRIGEVTEDKSAKLVLY